MQSTVLAIVNLLSVRPSVCHTLALCQNDSGYTIMRSSLWDTPLTLVSHD